MSKPVTENMFSFSGRRNRKSYILAASSMVAAMIVLSILSSALSAATDSVAPAVVGGLLYIPLMVLGIALASQRARDFGWSGWAILIPGFAFVLLFVPGTQGVNRYGPDPLMGLTSAQVTAAA